MNTSPYRVRQNLTQTVIGRPLLDRIENSHDPDDLCDVIIDPNLDFAGGREQAIERITELMRQPGNAEHVRFDSAHPYVFATLTVEAIRRVVAEDSAPSPGESAPASGKQRLNSGGRAIYRIWEDTQVEALLTNSVATVKADAAHAAFAANGKDIVWAVIDSGIDQRHEHFHEYSNLVLPPPLEHRDFTPGGNSPLTDEFGHGTHVAGIIAGMMDRSKSPQAILHTQDETVIQPLGRTVRGIAPECRLLSLKVLDANGRGKSSAVIEAIAAVQKLNDFGRRIVIHGVNLSLGYPFMAEWFCGSGQSPLCTEGESPGPEIGRGGRVVAAVATAATAPSAHSPGRHHRGGPATHHYQRSFQAATLRKRDHRGLHAPRTMPHTYGVSSTSRQRGPTGDVAA